MALNNGEVEDKAKAEMTIGAMVVCIVYANGLYLSP